MPRRRPGVFVSRNSLDLESDLMLTPRPQTFCSFLWNVIDPICRALPYWSLAKRESSSFGLTATLSISIFSVWRIPPPRSSRVRGAPSIRSPACSRGSRSLSDGMPDEVHTKYKNENLPVFGAEKKLGEHIQFSPASGPGRSDLTNRTPYTTIVSTL